MEKDGIQLRHVQVIDPDNQIKNGPSEGYMNNAFEGSEQNLDKKQVSNTDIDGEHDDEEFEGNACSNAVGFIQKIITDFYKEHIFIVWYTIYLVLLVAYFGYFIWCMYHLTVKDKITEEGSIRLIVITILLVIGISLTILSKFVKLDFTSFEQEFETLMGQYGFIIHICLIIAAIGGNIAVIVVEVILKEVDNLISLVGVFCFVVVFYVTSHNPARVNWRPVFWGLEIQFYFALAIIKWPVGNDIFQWCGDRVTEFLAHTDAGAGFVFGEDTFRNHFFAMAVLPVIVFFSTAIAILYYLGVMQFIIKYIARALAFALGTSPAESLNAAGNIFIGQSEAPLMIRPFLAKLTNSEIHAIMTGGFATIAGSVMAAYVLMGVPAKHLLSASVMSAPAALAMAKLSYPETKVSKAHNKDVYKIESGKERNIVEAASNGACMSVKLVANIAVNLIAFISLLQFVNATLTWFGERAGLYPPEHELLTFQFICSYVFWPMSWVMGVHHTDCRVLGELIGIKTFINEFVAYNELSKYIDNRANLTWYMGLPALNSSYTGNYTYVGRDIHYLDFNHTLVGGIIQDRSMVIATYALCGFSNVGSIGIMLGALGAMAPTRKQDLTKVVVRAMICGNVACFLTACLAGLMYESR
ncbi:solute carrier family 28 member 3-like isoform X2 [Mytilus californianus]|uniref:solute carrier family 28 member 3-like isoform X2 n=1 Tax=Mytilus californianus TaxID=6549 RepID=UPI002245DA68|nr:solute carrier family 28 member 3-like isoform X2 [Mytilus californianus]